MLRNKGLSLLLGSCALLLQPSLVPISAQEQTSLQNLKQSLKAQKKLSLFGSREIRSRSVRSFNKWTAMWRRHNLPRATEEQKSRRATDRSGGCPPTERVECSRAAWNKFVEEQQGVPTGELLDAVNDYMNKTTYIVDPVNWGIPDYWATPDEFFLKDGDCEDYAISKYVTLKRLGVEPTDMRIVILQDENLRVAHAVLAVRHEDKYMILDNQVNAVLPDTQILHYRPVYSINETGWWLHHKKRFTGK